ncbi:hypothetical protein [Nonomuraea dietziae]|uniref:hypothetical protein n=1 Tax=Nonomuraea dietziae TaxID=65515 RepID=UPI0034292656
MPFSVSLACTPATLPVLISASIAFCSEAVVLGVVARAAYAGTATKAVPAVAARVRATTLDVMRMKVTFFR